MSTRGNEKSPLELPKCPGVYCSQPSNISRVFNIDGKPVSYCNGDWCWTSAQKELLPDIPGTWYMIFYPPALKTTVSKTAVDSHSDIHIPWTLSRGIGEVCKADESSLTNTNIPLVPDDGLPEVTTYTKVQDMFWYRPFAPEGKMFVAFSPEINSILANGFAMPSLARSFKRLLQISKQFEYTKDGVVVKLIRQVYRPAGYSQLQNLASHILYQFVRSAQHLAQIGKGTNDSLCVCDCLFVCRGEWPNLGLHPFHTNRWFCLLPQYPNDNAFSRLSTQHATSPNTI